MTSLPACGESRAAVSAGNARSSQPLRKKTPPRSATRVPEKRLMRGLPRNDATKTFRGRS